MTIKHILKLVGVVIAIGGWLEFVLKPVLFWWGQPGRSLGALVVELAKFRNEVYDVPILSWLFLLTAPVIALAAPIAIATFVRFWINYLDSSETGISVIYTSLHIELSGANLEEAIVTRDQLFHANQKKTSAYHLAYGPNSPSGTLAPKPIDFVTRLNGKQITADIITDVVAKQHQVIETYTQDLPVSKFATYLPSSWVYALFNTKVFFQNVVAVRRVKIKYRDEYNHADRRVQVTAPLYPGSRVRVEVDFPDAQAPHHSDFACFRIMNNRVEKIDVQKTSDKGRTLFWFEVKDLYKETVRLTW